jgi:hypothetical protein
MLDLTGNLLTDEYAIKDENNTPVKGSLIANNGCKTIIVDDEEVVKELTP